MSGLDGALPPQRIVLEGRYCRLEPLRPEHAEALFAATSGEGEEERYRWLFEAPPQSVGELRDWIAAASARPDPLAFAVIDRATGLAGGRQTLMRITPKDGVIEVGGVLWGRGIARTPLATEALYLFARYVFDDLGYRRLEWKCNAENLPSKRAAERFGFTFEGVFRQHMIVKARNRDTAWFSMLDSEWPGIRTRLETWLAPDNFDGEGRQRERLLRWEESGELRPSPDPRTR